MAEIKTKVTNANVQELLSTIESESKLKDSLKLLELFEQITGEKAQLWGSGIIGFGQYHYESTRSSQGDWPLTAFSPRRQNLTIYIMPGFADYQELVDKLGKCKTSVSCIYINKLGYIDYLWILKHPMNTLLIIKPVEYISLS